MRGRIIPVPEGLGGLRADLGLSKLLGVSRAQAATLLQQGAITIDDIAVKKSDSLNPGDWLEIDWPDAQPDYSPEITPVAGLEVLFEDQDVIVVNKPAGVAAHTGPGWDGPTVVGALRAAGVRISTSGPTEREGIVHRLDAGTSGAMMVAKTELAYGKLKNEFRYHRVEKIYTALAQGQLKPPNGTVDAPIGRQVGKEFKMTICATGKESITHYDTIEAHHGLSLLEIQLETGRTHQIRVHFSALGHPLVGDTLYGANPRLSAKFGLNRQFLHATTLGFHHPRSGATVQVRAELPADLSEILAVWRRSG